MPGGPRCWASTRRGEGLDVRRRTGYVPESPVLYDWMTVAEIGWFAAAFHLDAHGTTSSYQYRYTELTRGFDLPATKKIKALSKGMRAKVSLSLALASDPSLLILDEPTSGLDVLVRRDFLESMVDLAGAGRTVLLSSHQIGEVERVASHVALLHKGKLILARAAGRAEVTDVSALGDVCQPRPSRHAAGGTDAGADRCIRRPAPGALAGPRRRPRRLRGRAGITGSRGTGDRNTQPRGNLHRLHAGSPPGAVGTAGGARGVRIGSRSGCPA